jgi:2'-5' RNA ligase
MMEGVVTASSAPLTSESCILVAVPEAEPAVGRHRAQLDRAAAWGVPAHVTVLYPFVPPDLITDTVIETARAAVAQVRAFYCEFRRSDWFGQDVVWLAPEPAEPFRALTSAVHAAFPLYRPFGGIYADVVPHLTIGDRPAGGPGALRAAEAEVVAKLPVRAHVSCAWLMTGSQAPASWHPIAELPLTQ